MTEKTKQKEVTKTPKENESENADDGNRSKDQQDKSYYYDDSYGYEIYNPDEEDEEDDE